VERSLDYDIYRLLTCNRYKPDVKLGYLTEELAFDDDAECAAFLCDHGAEQYLEKKADGLVLQTGKAGAVFQAAKDAAFRKVDIKGQI